MNLTFKIEGAERIKKALKELPEKLRRKVLGQAMHEGAKIIRDEARARAPSGSGSRRGGKPKSQVPKSLRQTIRVSVRSKRDAVTAKVVAGDRRHGVFYAGFVERGTEPHVIKARRGRLFLGTANFPVRVKHPGTQAKPFMRPAIEASSGRAIDAVAAGIRKRLAELVP